MNIADFSSVSFNEGNISQSKTKELLRNAVGHAIRAEFAECLVLTVGLQESIRTELSVDQWSTWDPPEVWMRDIIAEYS